MKEKIMLAYRLSSPDIDAHFYENAPLSTCCPNCRTVLDRGYIPARIKLYSGRLPDVGGTYDGQGLCSPRFKAFCEQEDLALDFFEIDLGKPFYHFRPRKALRYDAVKRRTRFLNRCPACGNFAEVIGSVPVYLLDVIEPIEEGIFRTDLEFGSGSQKGHQTIVGIKTAEKMVAGKFVGCTLMPIFSETTLH